MNLCSHHHEEICFDGRECPLCAAVEEKDEEITELNRQVKELIQERDDLQEQVDNLEAADHRRRN